MKNFVLFVCLFTLSCASTGVPLSEAPTAFGAIDNRWSLQAVTVDSDGADSVTRIWRAVEGGDPVLRTGDSRWWTNLQRDARIHVRLSAMDYPFAAEFVTQIADKARIDEVFIERYSGWERMPFPQERGETHANYARLRP